MDYELSRLQRLASTGDPDAASKLLSMRIRAGLNPYYVKQAAALGDPTALLLFSPAPPTNVYCNYDAGSLGFNDVDGVLGGIYNNEDLISIAVAFVRHSLNDAARIAHGQSPPLPFRVELIENLLELGERWVVSYRKHLEETAYSLRYTGHGEFFTRYQAYKATQECTQELKNNVQDLLVVLRDLTLTGPESDIRWAAFHIGRMAVEQYKTQLDAVWVSEYCRRAAGNGSEVYQRQELEWQRQFLIRWLLQ
jgi:hypothetical protein